MNLKGLKVLNFWRMNKNIIEYGNNRFKNEDKACKERYIFGQIKL